MRKSGGTISSSIIPNGAEPENDMKRPERPWALRLAVYIVFYPNVFTRRGT